MKLPCVRCLENVMISPSSFGKLVRRFWLRKSDFKFLEIFNTFGWSKVTRHQLSACWHLSPATRSGIWAILLADMSSSRSPWRRFSTCVWVLCWASVLYCTVCMMLGAGYLGWNVLISLIRENQHSRLLRILHLGLQQDGCCTTHLRASSSSFSSKGNFPVFSEGCFVVHRLETAGGAGRGCSLSVLLSALNCSRFLDRWHDHNHTFTYSQ